MDQMLIDDLAAHAFWESVQREGFASVTGHVNDRDFLSIWDINTLKMYIRLLEIDLSTDNIEKALIMIYDTVNNYMYDQTIKDTNINGRVYIEDFSICRPPEFCENMTLEKLKIDNNKVDDNFILESNKTIRKTGVLLIRSPLPAFILLKEKEIPPFVIVENTEKALGFQKKLILSTKGITLLPDNDFGYIAMATGVFTVPSSAEVNNQWKKIIPNATYAFNGAKFFF